MIKADIILLNELKHANGFSDNFVESLQDGLLIINTEGKIVVVNSSLCQITGFDKEELLGAKVPFPFWPPEFHAVFSRRFNELKKDGLNREIETNYLHKKSNRFPVLEFFASIKNNNDETIAYLLVIQENLKNKENNIDVEFQNSEIFSLLNYRKKYLDIITKMKITSHLDTTLNNISDGLVSLDNNWRYTYLNKKAGEFLGRKSESLIGRHIWTEFPEGVGLPFYNAFYKAVETQQTQYLIDYYEPFNKWFENRIYPSPSGIAICFTDITERVKSDELLIESKLQLDNIIDNIGDPLFVKDAESRLLIVNDSFCKIFGHSRADIIGKTLTEDVTPEEKKSFLRIDKQVLSSGIENVNEETLTIRDNKTRIISTKKTRFVDKTGTKFLIGVIRDITENKKVEKNNNMLRSLTEMSGDFIGLATLEGKPLYINKEGRKMIGLGMDSLPTNIADFFPKDYQDTIENVHLPAIYKKNKWKGEAYFKNFKTGDLIPIEMSGFLIKDSLSKNPIALGIVATNISIRKKAEKKLREKEKSLVIAQKIARIGSFNLDLETKKIKGSSALMNILGIDKNSEFNTDIWKTLIHTEDVSANLKEIQKCIETGEKFDMEFRVLTKNKNKLKWIHGLGELTFIDGKAVNFFGTAQDITDRKIAENKIAKANEQLTQANKELNILRNQLEQENVYLRNELDLVFNYEEMIYGSEAFSQVLSEVEKVAPTNATVLLLGESGTGKELLARAVHNTSTRKKKSLIKVNCSAIPRELIESELFGHKKGSFTGAINDKIGKFELADGGTLFLDEIGDLPLDMQPKILRFLQEGEIEVVGGLGLKKLDVRVIAATNRNLKEAIEEKQFREDLFFRLNVFPIEIPPLRKRREDIPLLVEHFVDKFNKAYEKNIRYIPDDAMNQLKNYNWPGNVRELENLIERAVIISNDNTLTVPGFETSAQESKKHINKRDTTLAAIQRKHILQVLENCEWKISGLNSASVLLDIKPSTLRDKMTKLGIKKPNKQ